jgi:hypothetical protein
MKLRERDLLDEPATKIAAGQATALLQNPGSAEAQAKETLALLGIRQGLFAPGILRSDATEPFSNGGHPAFIILPIALALPPSEFFPALSASRPGQRLGLSYADLKRLVRAAWRMDSAAGPVTLH